ncbi:hypothetical protein N8J89_23710 [Crossiella sp. CA-258035]|uniref:hypothetical protein n=1 Tax=Crossiella sp. CA-258035 TaxID=2981138 RepID=UPI0024BCC297|nr:hypothetical protein [Crossiella sp. CA-258035]WHT16138.1 hypothetical protein N8J89_23710 [Crossiella sp. CA-258035]
MCGPDTGYGEAAHLHDHSDHVIAARLAVEAVRRLTAPTHLVTYRGYNTQCSPVNLDIAQHKHNASSSWSTPSTTSRSPTRPGTASGRNACTTGTGVG